MNSSFWIKKVFTLILLLGVTPSLFMLVEGVRTDNKILRKKGAFYILTFGILNVFAFGIVFKVMGL